MTTLVRTSLTWVRQTLGWSNSWASWQERLVEFGFLGAALGLLVLGYFSGFWLTLALWTALALAAAVLQRLDRLKLFGPVLFYDMIRTARRSRYSLLRCLYALLLLLVLFWAYSMTSMRHRAPRKEAAEVAMHFFEVFMLVQLTAVFLLTPAYVAGSVAEEKDRKTLEFLLATDLRNREIILSKFGSRLCNLALFVLTGLPILSFLQFLGGIDPDLVLAGFAATGLSVLGIASIGILHSVLYKRPRDAIAMTYLVIIAYLSADTVVFLFKKYSGLSVFMLPLGFGSSPPTVADAVDVLSTGNIIVAITDVYDAGFRGQLATVVPTLLRQYASFHGLVCLVCRTWSILRLRALALKQTYGTVAKVAWYQRFRAPVGEQPMLWKEMNVEGALRVNWVGWIFVVILVLLTVGIGVWILAYFIWEYLTHPFGWHGDLVQVMNVWVRIAGSGVGCLTLLGVAVRASTTIRNEMDRDTFDALVATPLSSDAILLSKFVGSLFSVRLGWLWLGSILSLGVLTGGMHVLALPLFLGAWFVYACLFTMIGLWYSMVSRTAMRATVYTMLTAVGVSVGHWLIWLCCLPLLLLTGTPGGGDIPEYLAKFQFGLTPPAVLGFFAYSPDDLSRGMPHREFAELMGFSLLGLFLSTMASLMLWFVLIVPRFRHMTRRDQTSEGE